MNEDDQNFDAVVKDIIKKTLDNLDQRIISEQNVLKDYGIPETTMLVLSAMVFVRFTSLSNDISHFAALMKTFNITIMKMVEMQVEDNNND